MPLPIIKKALFYLHFPIFIISMGCCVQAKAEISSLSSTESQASEIFIPGTQDIPLMNGLKTDIAPDMDFDTPAGQVLTFEAKSDRYTGKDIINYYRTTLAGMGWKAIAPNHYIREKDSLQLTILRTRKPAIVRFEIMLPNNAE